MLFDLRIQLGFSKTTKKKKKNLVQYKWDQIYCLGFQVQGAVYNCITCQYDSCEFPLDCPGELTDSFTCVQCSVQYIMICNSMQYPTHPLSPHLT